MSGWADKKWPRSRGKCPRLGQKMPSDNSTGGQALNLCSTRCGAVCGSAQCRFLYFVVFMFVFFAFCILKSKSLLGQMWRCLWITSVSLQLTTSLSHHPSVTKPAQDVMLYTFSVGSYINSYILKAGINSHENIEDDEMLSTMLMVYLWRRRMAAAKGEADNGW